MKRAASEKPRTILVGVLLVAATVVAYGTLDRNEFVSLDDNVYITANPNVQKGLSGESLAWAFSSSDAENWHPLTWLSHMLDVEMYGMEAKGHHRTNLVLHVANAILLLLVLARMTGAFWPAAFVAAVFALHPLHVESVAWAAERKDVLSTLFWMLTLLAYARYVERPGVRRYVAVASALALGLMAKPMLVTLPFVLLLLDYWPLRREEPARRLIVEKLPLFALIVASSVVTYLVQQRGGAVENVPLDLRLANALVSYAGYVVKMFWPVPLAPLYPFPLDGVPAWKVVASALTLLAATAGAVLIGRKHRYVAVGWLWYVGTLVPVIGLVQVGYQASADRYTYIPTIGLTIMLAWGAAELVRRLRVPAVWLAAPVLLVLALLAWTTRVQVGHWRDTFTLCGHTISVTEKNYMMYANLGVAHVRKGELEQAVANLRKSVEARPDFDHGHYNLAVTLSRQGRTDEAARHYRRVLEITPDYATAHYNLGNILQARGGLAEAIGHYRAACDSNPDFLKACLSLGRGLHQSARLDEAIEVYREAVRRSPGSAGAHTLLAQALAARGLMDEARRHAAEAQRLQPAR